MGLGGWGLALFHATYAHRNYEFGIRNSEFPPALPWLWVYEAIAVSHQC